MTSNEGVYSASAHVLISSIVDDVKLEQFFGQSRVRFRRGKVLSYWKLERTVDARDTLGPYSTAISDISWYSGRLAFDTVPICLGHSLLYQKQLPIHQCTSHHFAL